jgi:hypothetical protein
MRLSHRITSALPALALAGCSTLSQPPPVLPEPYTALYLVKAGPYPLYAEARRAAQLQARADPADGPWLHSGCIFDVQRTRPDQQDASYVWAYGQVFRCDDLIETGIPEPEMGVRPHELRIYDGSLGYFPMSLLEPHTGAPPAPRT